MNNNQSGAISLFVTQLRNNIWSLGIPSFIFGIADRSIASLTDGYLSAIELVHLFTASFFFISWLSLKPEKSLNSGGLRTLQRYRTDLTLYQDEVYPCTAQARLLELQEQHLISQEYILPFPYLCQIYHLLNLKHLETIHNFSLNNLKVINVSDFQPTDSGGIIRFQTILDSPVNPLRIWRSPIVEVDLILHNPYTVELSIPVYGNKRITVIFNALPISDTEHRLCIDIYSNLGWPRPLLQILLHFASCLTLFEDLPYLQKIAERNVERLFSSCRASNQETMLLFKRFVDLYSSRIKPSQPMKVIEAAEA
ncbi:MAG: hypothetical protein KME25_07370 [Symplocastrum torsivum CPER-KK1]|jgi:hypothetical protein|uniref:Uncharacterized protein n=1 Tax=Symplocastrum torsivum CPER-KK1 TaxID=450513 RepID=A0A951U8X1_9CYAN|nr:hypothetical protein [Symplocastrum torsivum CPER-KK1]